jgi:hypothetical protein
VLRGAGHVLVLWLPRPAPSGERGTREHNGRFGVLGLIRYSSSNVGAYDELFWLRPWRLSLDEPALHCIERIYVSSPASLRSGRANWGIPKELARFQVERVGAASERVRVASDSGPIASFLVTSGKRGLVLDAGLLPASLRRLGQIDGGRLFTTEPRVAARTHTARFSELSLDPRRFVDLERARPLLALTLSDLEMHMPEARVRHLG